MAFMNKDQIKGPCLSLAPPQFLSLALALAGLDLGLGSSGDGDLLLEQRNHLVELLAALVVVLLQLFLPSSAAARAV